MDKRHKEIMGALVGKLRHILVGGPTDYGSEPGDLDRELERLGIDREGNVAPIDALADVHNGDGLTYRVASTQLQCVPENRRMIARREIVERAAYTWINRLLALRAMEVRGLIADTLRVSEDYDGLSEKLYLLRLDSPTLATEADGGWWVVLREACSEMARALPGLFALDNPDGVLHPTAGALIQCIELVGGKISILPNVTQADLDAAFADPDAIGWAYQFYQAEAKAAIDAKCKSGGKAASRAELAAKTQLFTEPYMVQWLLQNSLGRSYHEAHPQSRLPATWSYYIQPEQNNKSPETPFLLKDLTLLDPCMGSGHFLRAAFDLFVAMYREQYPEMSAVEIADFVLSQHLYGIDLDPRAAQLSALTLYLRAWETVQVEHKSSDMALYVPPVEKMQMHLATTPTNLDRGALDRHIQRYPHDEVYRPLLRKVFESLEQVDVLGSLLRSREYLDQAIAELQRPHTVPLAYSQDEATVRREVVEMARIDEKRLRQDLLDIIAASFRSEARNTDDVSMALFGREAERGVRLLQVLNRQYAVVVTNPPYLGNGYMDVNLKKYIATYYKTGKRDLYAAFILRCLELCNPDGRVAMVTMHSWMFLRNYAELRALSEKKLKTAEKQKSFTGILREVSIEALAHLGENAFEEISGEVVKSVMYTMKKSRPLVDHQIIAFRQVNLNGPWEKSESLKAGKYIKKLQFRVAQNTLLQVSDLSISVYHLPQVLLDLLREGETVGKLGYASWGVSSSNNDRFLRLWWEAPIYNNRWFPHVKGGRYCKWEGLDFWVVEWRYSGIAIKMFILERYPYLKNNYELKVRDHTVNTPGWTFSSMVGKGFAVRQLHTDQITNAKSPAIFLPEQQLYIGGFLNSIVSTFILQGLNPNLNVDEGYVAALPIKKDAYQLIAKLVDLSVFLKKEIINRCIVERQYIYLNNAITSQNSEALLHSIEGMINTVVMRIYNLSEQNIQQILDETGTPAGWYPLVAGYDKLPELSEDLDSPRLPQELYDYLFAHKRVTPNEQELAHIKANLRKLYKEGPSVKNGELEESEEEGKDKEGEDWEVMVARGRIAIPTETFLEELSVKLQLHPISVYWLLEELQAVEGVRCEPEELRLLEDRLSVLVLRLLGHRWPKQIEAFEPVPGWAERGGIIPLVPGTGHRTLAERMRERLYAEEGALGAQRLEERLRELTGQDLEQWLRVTFFKNHTSQFKKRPVVWHLASTPPKGGTNAKKKRGESAILRTPAFECVLYYHACAGDVLARIRNQYVQPLLQSEQGKVDPTQLFVPDTISPFAQERIRELETFIEQLQEIEERGFTCPELQEIVAEEELDIWCGDGYEIPESKEAFQRAEGSWHVDINDGVRVNIAPLQLAGVLTKEKEVLNSKDAKNALGDRARWRADERRWVREGKLPRCGWLDERVPASPVWEKPEIRGASEQRELQLILLPEDIDLD